MSEIRVENIIGETGTDAVKFTKGINVTGIVTATNVSIGSSVTATSFFGSGAGLSGVSAGKILQVVHVDKNDFFSTTSTSFTDITGLTADITPTSASNYILVDFKCTCGGGDNLYATLKIQRKIGSGSYGDPSVITPSSNNSDASHAGCDTDYSFGLYKTRTDGARIKDLPNTTSQVSYKIQVRSQAATFVLNRTKYSNDGNTATDQAQGVSSITLMEVSA